MAEQGERIRLRFSKTGALRFLSHRDLLRSWSRAFRRARLPLRWTEGFNPRPKISFALALAVGIESEDEVLDLTLAHPMTPESVRQALEPELPTGIEIRSAQVILGPQKAQAVAAEYELRMPEELAIDPAAVNALLARPEIWVDRQSPKGSSRIDLRPFLQDIQVTGNRLTLRLAVLQGRTARPDELLALLGAQRTPGRPAPLIRRTRLELA
jgi:radical SAM-linked protein